MPENVLERLWNRLDDRYGQNEGGDCGCGSIEEPQSESAGPEPDTQ